MELSLEKVLKIVWKNIIFIAILTIVCGISAYFITTMLMPKTYVSKIGFTVISTASDTNRTNPSYLNTELNYTRNIVKSKVEMLKTNDYYEMVSQKLDSDIETLKEANPDMADRLDYYKMTARAIGGCLSFSITDETELFTIYVTTNSPNASKMIADAIETTANKRLTELSGSALNSDSGSDVPLADTVKCYEKPRAGSFAGPNTMLNTMLGFMLGLAVSFLISFIREISDVRVKSGADLNEKFDIPLLGTIPSFKTVKK